jgi:hypothetical protein
VAPLIQPQFITDPFGDSALYLEFLLKQRAMLLDLGDPRPLSGHKIVPVIVIVAALIVGPHRNRKS